MVTIIKNQLLKHLSRFTKNLSPEQINVSALKGQGTLSSLELDEAVLTDLLELPPWMKLSSATCGRATFRVHWTKLKTMPIELNLDDVQIMVETCSEPRSGDTPSSAPPAFPASKYSFIHKVIDGISITVNTARIQFSSPVFVATVQMSKITVESKTPQWQKGDLRLTRLKDPQSQQLLIFKEVSWQSARIEAKEIKEGVGLPPLRLLTNQAFCRITMKKRIEDCFVVGSRIVLILEEALWVLTDKQLGAALAFADSLSTLVRKASAQVTRDKAQRKLETLPEYLAQYYQSEKSGNVSKSSKTVDPLAKLFSRHDVMETSYHFFSPKIDLHLCDDPGPGRSSHPSLMSGAALQVTLQKLQFDYYPYHLASADRNRWPNYRESAAPHSQWLRQALTQFRGSLLTLFEASLQKNSHAEDDMVQGDFQRSMSSPTLPSANFSYGGSPAKKTVFEQFSKLMTTCVILRLEDYTLYKVTTGERKEIPKAFISSDRERFTLPDEVRALHVEFTHFYYPGHIQFPVPTPKLYIQVNPTRVLFDLPSCLWCNSFVLNLLGCVKSMQGANEATDSDLAYVDINVEAIMPRVIVDSGSEFPTQKDRPRTLVVQVSRASITNCGGVAGGTGELAACMAALSSSSLLSRPCCTDVMFKHAAGDDMFVNLEKDILCPRALWNQPKIVWCVRLEPVWADFCGARASPKPTPLLDAVPFTLWVYLNMDDKKTNNNTSQSMNSIHSYTENYSKKHLDANSFNSKDLLEDALKINEEPDMQIIGQCNHLVSVQLNHYQYLVVMRLAERLTELAAFLTLDAARVAGPKAKPKNMVVGCIVPQVEVTLVLPSVCPGKESSRDLDSVLPDSSSLVDLHQNTESGTLCYNPHGNSLNVLSQSSVERHSALTSSMLSVEPSLVQQDKSSITQDRSPAFPEAESQDLTNTKENLPNITNINASISSMKRGFTNLISSLDAALKPSEQGGQPPTASTPQDHYQWDTVSVASSDSERYIMVQLAHSEPTDAAFKLWDGNPNVVEGGVEVAAEVIERSSSPSERSLASSCRRRDLVSMCTFKMQHVEVLQVSQGFFSRVSVNIGDVSAEDCPSIPWDELQSKFSSRSRGWSESNLTRSSSISKEIIPKINVKLDHFPHQIIPIPYGLNDSITLECVMGSFSGNLDVTVKDINLTLNMSTALGLSDFIEDEIITTPLPLEVLLEGVCVNLNEDRPASSISSPGGMPLKLSLSGLKLVRGCDGVLHLRPAALNPFLNYITDPESIESSTVKKLAQENEELRRRLNALERLALENDALRRSKEEMDILKSCLLTAQDEVATLLGEKTTLLATVKSLQEHSSGVEVRGNSIVTWTRSGNR